MKFDGFGDRVGDQNYPCATLGANG